MLFFNPTLDKTAPKSSPFLISKNPALLTEPSIPDLVDYIGYIERPAGDQRFFIIAEIVTLNLCKAGKYLICEL